MFATDEELETDPEQYDCQSCVVADALDALWPENHAAWTLSRKILSRFTVDQHCVGVVLDRLTRELDADDLLDLTQRLAVIYDEIYPAPPAPPT